MQMMLSASDSGKADECTDDKKQQPNAGWAGSGNWSWGRSRAGRGRSDIDYDHGQIHDGRIFIAVVAGDSHVAGIGSRSANRRGIERNGDIS